MVLKRQTTETRQGLRWALVLAASVFGAGCPGPVVPEITSTVRFETLVGGVPLPTSGAPEIELANDVVIERAVLWVSRLSLVSDALEVEDETELAVALRNAGASAHLFEDTAPGLYSRVRVRIDEPGSDDEDAGEVPAELIVDDELLAMRMWGTVGGVPFDFLDRGGVDLDLRCPIGLDLTPGDSGTFRISIDAEAWLAGIDLAAGDVGPDGIIVIDDTENGDLAGALLDGFEAVGTVSVQGIPGS